MSEIRTVRTARKTHDCGTDLRCQGRIQPGDRYLIAALPPADEDNQTGHWLRLKVCQPCAERWGEPIDEQATPRRARSRAARRRDPLDTVPRRRHVDEPRLTRPVTTIHAPALSA